jgi:NTE family protein
MTPRSSPLDDALDILRVRQYFNAITMAREAVDGIRKDASFLSAARRAVLPLPFDRHTPPDGQPFPTFRTMSLEHFQHKRVGLLATGGSGTLASVVGAARAFEEAGITPAVISVCSGSSLFGFPIAAGRSAEEVAEFTLGLSTEELIDVDWKALVTLLPRVARGFVGILRGDRIEAAYERLLGDMTLGELAIPAYAPVWDIEHNQVETSACAPIRA